MSGDWLEVTVAAPEGESAELAAEALFAAGASGLEEREPLADGRALLVAYIPPDRRPLDAAPLAAAGAAVIGARSLAERDWEAEWKRDLAPLPIGRRLVVVPSWTRDAEVPEGRTAIRLEPGSAFGTGIHPTTELAAAALEEALAPGSPFLDVGTGSGILAIAAYLLGARPVLAIDDDPTAVEEAWANARRNGCRDGFEVSDRPLDSLVARYAVVVANLDAPTLARVGAALAARVAPGGGTLIVSGLREGESSPTPPALELAAVTTRDGWRCERYRRA